MNSPCWTFLTWISAVQQLFHCSATFTHFFRLFKFQTKPLVLINFPFEPLRNNASAVFLFSKNRKNQSINQSIIKSNKIQSRQYKWVPFVRKTNFKMRKSKRENVQLNGKHQMKIRKINEDIVITKILTTFVCFQHFPVSSASNWFFWKIASIIWK